MLYCWLLVLLLCLLCCRDASTGAVHEPVQRAYTPRIGCYDGTDGAFARARPISSEEPVETVESPEQRRKANAISELMREVQFRADWNCKASHSVLTSLWDEMAGQRELCWRRTVLGSSNRRNNNKCRAACDSNMMIKMENRWRFRRGTQHRLIKPTPNLIHHSLALWRRIGRTTPPLPSGTLL